MHSPAEKWNFASHRMTAVSHFAHRCANPYALNPDTNSTAHASTTLGVFVAGPGDDGGVPGGGREQQRRQQQQEQQRGAARDPHGDLGPGRQLRGRWGRAGRSAERRGGRLTRACRRL